MGSCSKCNFMASQDKPRLGDKDGFEMPEGSGHESSARASVSGMSEALAFSGDHTIFPSV